MVAMHAIASIGLVLHGVTSVALALHWMASGSSDAEWRAALVRHSLMALQYLLLMTPSALLLVYLRPHAGRRPSIDPMESKG